MDQTKEKQKFEYLKLFSVLFIFLLFYMQSSYLEFSADNLKFIGLL